MANDKTKKVLKSILTPVIIVSLVIAATFGVAGIVYAITKDTYTPLQYCYGEVSCSYGEKFPYSYKEIHSSQEDKPAHLYYYDYEITIYDEDKMDVWGCSICFYSALGEKPRYKVDDCKWVDCDLAYSVSYGKEMVD